MAVLFHPNSFHRWGWNSKAEKETTEKSRERNRRKWGIGRKTGERKENDQVAGNSNGGQERPQRPTVQSYDGPVTGITSNTIIVQYNFVLFYSILISFHSFVALSLWNAVQEAMHCSSTCDICCWHVCRTQAKECDRKEQDLKEMRSSVGSVVYVMLWYCRCRASILIIYIFFTTRLRSTHRSVSSNCDSPVFHIFKTISN